MPNLLSMGNMENPACQYGDSPHEDALHTFFKCSRLTRRYVGARPESDLRLLLETVIERLLFTIGREAVKSIVTQSKIASRWVVKPNSKERSHVKIRIALYLSLIHILLRRFADASVAQPCWTVNAFNRRGDERALRRFYEIIRTSERRWKLLSLSLSARKYFHWQILGTTFM